MQGLGHCDHGAADDDLVGELGELPGADRPEPGRPPERREDIRQTGDDVDIAARHDGQRAVARAGLAAGHWRVDIADAARREPLRLRLAGLDGDRAHDHEHRAGP